MLYYFNIVCEFFISIYKYFGPSGQNNGHLLLFF